MYVDFYEARGEQFIFKSNIIHRSGDHKSRVLSSQTFDGDFGRPQCSAETIILNIPSYAERSIYQAVRIDKSEFFKIIELLNASLKHHQVEEIFQILLFKQPDSGICVRHV